MRLEACVYACVCGCVRVYLETEASHGKCNIRHAVREPDLYKVCKYALQYVPMCLETYGPNWLGIVAYTRAKAQIKRTAKLFRSGSIHIALQDAVCEVIPLALVELGTPKFYAHFVHLSAHCSSDRASRDPEHDAVTDAKPQHQHAGCVCPQSQRLTGTLNWPKVYIPA